MSPEKTAFYDTKTSPQNISEIRVQDRCLSALSNIGLSDMLEYLPNIYNLNNFEDISNIPIAPELIPDRQNSEIILSSKVTDKYHQLIEAINLPESAKEYPFLLLGEVIPDATDSIIFYDLIPCCKDNYKPESKIVDHDTDILLLAASKYSVIAIGHTHPLLDDSEICDTFTSKMEESDKEAFMVKRAGLNLSAQDIYQLLFVQEQLTTNKILECVIMYNGDFILVDTSDNKLSKYPSVYGDDNGEITIPVPAYTNSRPV